MAYTNPEYTDELKLPEQLENMLNARPKALLERTTQYMLVVVEHMQQTLDPKHTQKNAGQE